MTMVRNVAILAALIAGAYGGVLYLQSSRYQRVDGTVTQIREACSLNRLERDGSVNRAYITSPMRCDDARKLRTTRAEYRDADISRATYVTFRYVSPADGHSHIGSFAQSRHADGSPIRVGDRLAVLAHTGNPVIYKRPD